MPGYDRTGPNGGGPMTGRGAGYCSGNNNQGIPRQGMPLRLGQGRGKSFNGTAMYNRRGELRPRYQKTQIPEKSISERVVNLLEKIVDAVTTK